jgi:pimeloyl-ACP methyl ester carboxylesterase
MVDGPRERVLAVHGLALACRSWGDERAVPTLALHGWLDNAASYDFVAPHLRRLSLCALDLPGHGLSEHRPTSASYHFVDYVADALGAADALGWDRFALLGHSLGAGIATLLAAVVPERVTRAVLIEGLGPATSAPADAPSILRRALADARRAESSPAARYATLEEAVRARMTAGKLAEPAARALCERGLRRSDDGSYVWRSDRRLRSGSRLRLTEDHTLAFIRAMTVPTLLIRGVPGLPIEERAQSARIAAHPDLRVRVVTGGHHLHMEDAAPAVAELIDEFLGDPLAPAP